jgi:predicted metal-dependent phosphoesterase TrpH
MSERDRLVDLHMHTTASDGTLSPTALVELARQKGLAAIAVTDHDTTAGVAEAVSAGGRLGVEVIPGIEISAMREKGTLHIVGLFIDPDDPALREKCAAMQAERSKRNGRMVRRLGELGMPITLEEVSAKAGGEVLGRPHVAAVMLEKGYVQSFPEAFDKWLAKGQPAYFPKSLFDPRESIQLIHDAGGIAIIAHPSQLKCRSEEELDEAVAELCAAGIDGIETQWSNAAPGEMALAERLAEKHGLARSGGSDFHGSMKPDIQIGAGLGQLRMTYDILNGLRAAAARR